MLVLTRKRDERIYIGDDVVITISAILDHQHRPIEGARVRVGITAPKEVIVLREEVAERNK